jgi:hypothetical protein
MSRRKAVMGEAKKKIAVIGTDACVKCETD